MATLGGAATAGSVAWFLISPMRERRFGKLGLARSQVRYGHSPLFSVSAWKFISVHLRRPISGGAGEAVIESSMKNLVSTIATIWRLSLPYFRSEDRWPARILLAAVVTLELSIVGMQVILNQWYNRFYNTLEDRDWNAFVSAILFFCVLAAIYTVVAVYQVYLNQWLQIRWRRWMTQTIYATGSTPPITAHAASR